MKLVDPELKLLLGRLNFGLKKSHEDNTIGLIDSSLFR